MFQLTKIAVQDPSYQFKEISRLLSLKFSILANLFVVEMCRDMTYIMARANRPSVALTPMRTSSQDGEYKHRPDFAGKIVL